MGVIRVLFIIWSLILVSNVPDDPASFFGTRFVFYGMLLLDFINVRMLARETYDKLISKIGIIICSLILVIDFSGLCKFIIYYKNEKEILYLTINKSYSLLKYIPDVKIETYIVLSAIITIIVSGWELVYNVNRDRKTKGKTGQKAKIA
ncbi:hypothetical protein CN982_18530 [Bacillus cereus]|uniref:hypothetical protein n=1 Tax=Bacillus cereus TaxID=1396 RepID=UPI000BFB6E16|nr:hypothetical protein [Bacillus cereus]PGO26329.1 hypothetical protein CN982_18530 [Bacillus cereus]